MSSSVAHPGGPDHLSVEPLAALSDNYIWLLTAGDADTVTVVDPGDATPVIAWLDGEAGRGRRLDRILITHHHRDHTGGVTSLVERYGAEVIGPLECRSVAIDHRLGEGDVITLFGRKVRVLHTPGHTLDHIVYLVEDATPLLLCGDTLFHAGCGRLFEGTAEQMQANFSRLRELPPSTLVFGAHEYSLANLAFAQSVEPGNAAIDAALERARALRDAGKPTLPSEIGRERMVNPFMRYDDPGVRKALSEHAGRVPDSDGDAFSLLREWKDHF
ncbi:hydroxyacylglutathione hydrolase [Halotalea alkalilenta]|uniref:hydroxyacylglutathione hydrolase n=1 Tax=Halotalea alkalilenta TaxID=376489 RepID=UPI0006945361|nr:hydroxyacylglutathione hydrolase [Halotalea alkalilenta]